MASQISKGETFTDVSPGKSVTSTRLNNLVAEATLLPGAITEQTDISTSIASDDTLLLHDTSASTLKKVQAANLLPPEVITGKTDISTSLASDDLLLMSDTSASGALKKVQAANLLVPEAITGKSALTAVAQDDLHLVSDTSASAALKYVTTANLLGTFTSSVVAMNGLSAGKNIDEAHGLGAVPRFVRGVLVNTTTDLGYSVGDEVPFDDVIVTTAARALSCGASATNVFAIQNGASTGLYIQHKTLGTTATPITQGSWSMKIYAHR